MDNCKIFESNLGKFLKDMLMIVEKKIKEDVHYERIYNILNVGIGKIRKKLIEGFFSFGKIKQSSEFRNLEIKRVKKIRKLIKTK